MDHPFKDKFFAFIGGPGCKTSEARDALAAVGGVFDGRINSFTDFVVEFQHNGNAQKYKRAVSDDRNGYLVLLDEMQFFDILEGRAEPPPRKENTRKGVIVSIPADHEAAALEYERARQDILSRKRLDNLAKYGTPMPDGGRMKADLRLLDKASRVFELMKGETSEGAQGMGNSSERCDKCGNPVKVHFTGEGGVKSNLCLDCYNRTMAGMTGTDFMEELPKRLSYKGRGGKTHNFDIELLILPLGKSLTATEIGKTRRKVDVHGELDDDVWEMLETLKKRIKKSLSTVYMDKGGYVSKSKAVGYIEFNRERDDHDIIIDGKPYTWEELKKNVSAHEGWKIKIEFGDVGDELD
jgi:hypothetical protein